MTSSWDKYCSNEQMYYVKLEDDKVIYCDVFEGGRTRIEWKCTHVEFLSKQHEIYYRIRDTFGLEVLTEITLEIQKQEDGF